MQREDLPSFFGSRRLTYVYDTTGTGTKGRPINLYLGVNADPTQDQSNNYYYNSDGRLGMISGAGAGYSNQYFNYSYTANSRLIASTVNTALGYTDVRTYDPQHNWTDARETKWGATTKANFAYTQDALGRFTNKTMTGEMFSRYGNGTQGINANYGYNDRSELTIDRTDLAGTGTVLTGRNDAYSYDNLGNRSSTAGMTHNGNSAAYTSNNLNQYTARTVPGVFDVAGAAGSGATVTVNGSSTGVTRHGEYFFKGHGLANSPNPVYTTLAVSDGTTTANLSAFVAGTPETLTYDFDGNLTSDGRWSYGYDAENRITWIQATASAVAAGHPNIALHIFYDCLGRRIWKINYAWNGSTWVAQHHEKFIYNGWNLIAEVNGVTGAVAKNFFWGLDLTGTMQGAGGVGGLLMTQEAGQTYLPAYDALGNIHAMIKASTGSVDAAYEYDAFGNTLRESGTYAASNPFRFSTKFTDIETGLVYFGYRYYSPTLGRFVCRDPKEEDGGRNLYAFLENHGVNSYDYLGLTEEQKTPNSYGIYGTMGLVRTIVLSHQGTRFGGAPTNSVFGSLAGGSTATSPTGFGDLLLIQEPNGTTTPITYNPNTGIFTQQSQAMLTGSIAQGGFALGELSRNDGVYMSMAQDQLNGLWVNVGSSEGRGINEIPDLSASDIGAAALSGLTLRAGASVNLAVVGSDATLSRNRSNGITTATGEVAGALLAPTGVGAASYATVQGTIPLYNRPTDFSVGFLAAPVVAFGVTVDFSESPSEISEYLSWRYTPTNIRFDLGIGAGGKFDIDVPSASTVLIGVEQKSDGSVKKTNVFNPDP